MTVLQKCPYEPQKLTGEDNGAHRTALSPASEEVPHLSEKWIWQRSVLTHSSPCSLIYESHSKGNWERDPYFQHHSLHRNTWLRRAVCSLGKARNRYQETYIKNIEPPNIKGKTLPFLFTLETTKQTPQFLPSLQLLRKSLSFTFRHIYFTQRDKKPQSKLFIALV